MVPTIPILSQPPSRRGGIGGAGSSRRPLACRCARKSGSARTALAPALRSDRVPMPSPTFAPPSSAGKIHPYPESTQRRRFPQDDCREIDHLWQVRAHGKTPENRVRIDETCRHGNFARGAVRADHEVCDQRFTRTQLVPNDSSSLLQRLLCPSDEGYGPGIERGPRGAWRRMSSSPPRCHVRDTSDHRHSGVVPGDQSVRRRACRPRRVRWAEPG